jgi:peptide/nickel transport system substrate-binding protein
MIQKSQRSRPRLTRSVFVVVTAACLAFTTACSSGGTNGAAPAADRPLVVAQTSDVLTLDPSVDTSPISLNVFKNIYDQLTNIAADGSVKPQLATSWETNKDATVWTFTIRNNVKFTNGTPLTVDDIIWSYTMIQANTKSPVASYLKQVKSIEKSGDKKIQFTLTEPFALFDRQVSLISILPRAAYEKAGAQDFAQHPIGSGPYKVIEWIKDDHIKLEANKDYWDGVPSIKTVLVRPVPSESARASGLTTGELDIVPVLPPSSVQQLQSVKSVNVLKVASNRVLYLGFNTANPLLSKSLRQAADMAIDRNAITNQLLGGLGKPEGQVVAPVTFGYDKSILPTAYNPAKAKELVAASGYKGEEILFQYPNNRYSFGTEVAQAVAGYLKAVGINVKLVGMEYSAFFPLWVGNKLNAIHLFAYGPSIMDSDLPLGSIFVSGSHGYWNNPEVDALVKKQRAQTDPAQRQATISTIWKMSQEAVPYSVLYNEIQAYGVSKNVQWTPRPDERIDLTQAKYKK